MKSFVWAGAVAGILVLATQSGAAAQTAPAVISTKCQTCHGRLGDSVTPTIPRLNGQHATYLAARLRAFLDPGSQDPHATDAMWETVRQVDDATLDKVAAYYDAQKPTPALASGTPALIAEGKAFYEKGNASERVPACQACHGAQGEGGGQVARLAGQHGAYLKAQLERLRFNLRANGIMHPNVNAISNHEIAAIVAYLANN